MEDQKAFGLTFTVSEDLTITATTPDGYAATSHTAQDALDGALAKREEVLTIWTPQQVNIKAKFPTDATSEDFQYWSDRASEIEGSPVILSPKV